MLGLLLRRSAQERLHRWQGIYCQAFLRLADVRVNLTNRLALVPDPMTIDCGTPAFFSKLVAVCRKL